MPQKTANHISKPFSRIALWLLVLSLCWCSAGAILWNSARTICYHYVRQHQQRPFDTLHISTVVLQGTGSELVWVKKDEIRYYGKMFDIKHRLVHNNGMVSLVGHYDGYEDKLFKMLRSLVNGKEEQNPQRRILPVWEMTAILPPLPVEKPIQLHIDIKPYQNIYIPGRYISLCLSPPVPPPDVAAI